MKKVLLISYHALPLDVISSYRTQGYLNHFASNNIRPTLISHFWDNKNHTNPSFNSFKNYDEIRIPMKKSALGNLTRMAAISPILSKPLTLLLNLAGVFDLHTIDSYFSMKSFLEHHLIEHKFDFILSIFSPQYQVKIPYIINRKFKIPYAVDFRDLWVNTVIGKDYQPSLKEKISDSLTSFYWKKWTSNASFTSITSQPWLDFLNKKLNRKGIVIKNGFEDCLLPMENEKEYLEILHTGSLYNNQKLEIFLRGAKLFLSNNTSNIKVVFVGSIRKGSNSITGYLNNPEKLISSYLEKDNYELIDRVQKKDVLKLIQKTDILLFPSFPDHPGTYSGKFFYYVGSCKNILMFPTDNGVCEKLLNQCNCGYIANTPQEINQYLISKYNEKRKFGYLKYKGNKKEIAFYSRKHQSKLMADKIKSFI